MVSVQYAYKISNIGGFSGVGEECRQCSLAWVAVINAVLSLRPYKSHSSFEPNNILSISSENTLYSASSLVLLECQRHMGSGNESRRSENGR
jgi:hypothetical protein